MEFIFKYHPAWLLLATVVAFAYAFYLYRKDELLEDVKRSTKILLGVFRFVSTWLIFLLLLGIILENLVDRKEKPLVFIAQDVSESILLTADSTYYKNEFVDELKKLGSDLSEEYEVVEYSFDGAVHEGISNEYDGKTTDIAQVFTQIFDQYTNRNIGAVIMSSDGVYNVGSNPIYEVTRKSFIPIYTIGIGDTNQVRDVRIDLVKHNDIAFLGNDFPVEVVLSQDKCGGEKVKVGIYRGDKLIKEETVEFKDDKEQATVSFTLTASSSGYQKYTTKVTVLDDEFSQKNNVSNFYIEVIDGRQKILLAYDGPHPDISALRYVIENNKNYEVTAKAFSEIDQAEGYDLILLHNYQSTNNEISEIVNSGSTPCLFIVGNQTDISALSRAKVGVSGNRTDVEDVRFSLNPSFKDILLSPATIQMISSAPPLQSPFGDFNYSGSIDVLAYQKIGNIVLDKPLIYFTRKQSNRYGVIMGEGLWRWRFYDQMKNQNTNNFEDFIGKLITFLAVKENRDPFKVKIENEYTESQSVVVKAELYNKSFELINEPEVSFDYTNENGKTFQSAFVRTGSAYRLDLGKLQQGIYDWKARTEFQGVAYEKEGTFVVKEIKLEMQNITADHRLLKNISASTSGKFFLPTEVSALKDDILNRDDLVTVVYQEKSFDDLIDYKILFILIILLLSVEWFFRKFNGAY